MSKLWPYLKSVKAPLSYVVGLMAAGAEAKGNTTLAVGLGLIAAWLNGAGHAASDAEVKARQ